MQLGIEARKRKNVGTAERRSPFRYPGGKAFLAQALEDRIRSIGDAIECYAEPYAGGAGAAIELLGRGVVKRIILNDFDRRIYCAWDAIINHNDCFQQCILDTPATIESWYRMRDVVLTDEAAHVDPFELGFATFFLNRTNRSGIVLGAGPIGGYKQMGKWRIDARYSRDSMLSRIQWIGEHRERIQIRNLDGIEFLRSFAEGEANDTFFFIDPPYVNAGSRLYLNAMNDMKHRDLAAFLIGNQTLSHWTVTYDDCELIRCAYSEANISSLTVNYSLQKKRLENEVCISPAE